MMEKSYCYFRVLQSDFSSSLQNCALEEIEASTEILSMPYLYPPHQNLHPRHSLNLWANRWC